MADPDGAVSVLTKTGVLTVPEMTVDEVKSICRDISDAEWRKFQGKKFAAVSVTNRCILGTGTDYWGLRKKMAADFPDEQVEIAPNRYPSRKTERSK